MTARTEIAVAATHGSPELLFVTSQGGHLAQLLVLREWWGGKTRAWVAPLTSDVEDRLRGERVVHSFFPTTRNALNALRNLVLAARVLRALRPRLVVSAGAGVTVPFFIVARLLRIPTVFIEVYDRLDTPTLTGRLAAPFTTRQIVQWESQLDFYPRATLVGPLLVNASAPRRRRTVGSERLVVACVGTDHHPFDRLVEWMDHVAWHAAGLRVVTQHGYSRAPEVAEAHAFLSHDALRDLLSRADAVVCHAGPGTIMDAVQLGQTPVVVPRDPALGEHVDDHQLRFAAALEKNGQAWVARDRAGLEVALNEAWEQPGEHRVQPKLPRIPAQRRPVGLPALVREVDTLIGSAASRRTQDQGGRGDLSP